MGGLQLFSINSQWRMGKVGLNFCSCSVLLHFMCSPFEGDYSLGITLGGLQLDSMLYSPHCSMHILAVIRFDFAALYFRDLTLLRDP